MTAPDPAHRRPERRAAELRRALDRASRQYYDDGTSELSDSEFDALLAELAALEAAHPELVVADSPTQRVGAPLPKGSSFAKAAHLAPMLSLESLTSAEEVAEFVRRARSALGLDDGEPLAWAVEPKLDGVSANLLYEDGALVRGLSRGDGAVGEDITRNLRTIRNLPLRLAGDRVPARIEVRGEVILGRTAFEALRAESETTTDTPFRNARNTVAGTLKLLDPGIVRGRRLEFICWGVGVAEGLEAETYREQWEALRAFGFRMADDFTVVDSLEAVLAFHRDLEARRDAIEYEMDGIVAKVDRIDYQRRLGRTAKAPRWALAFKFAPRRGTTRVREIGAQVGRTGKVTPVAHLDPLELAGVTVSRATLHNWGLLAERDIRVGDTVDVERAGDVIPAVVHVHTRRRPKSSRPVEPPVRCPECASALEPEGAFLYCVNLECPAQLRGRVVHLASRRALDIGRLGPKYADQLIEAGLIRRLEDVFALPDRRDEILALDRWGEKAFQNLCDELGRAKHPTLARFLNALGIRQVGEQTARDLADAFGDLERIAEATAEQLVEVDGVGPEVAASLRGFFELPENQRFLAAVRAAGVEVAREAAPAGGALAGRVFCFTGGLSSMSRDEARALVERLGGKASASVTKKVTDVVSGESSGSKLDKARKLGLPVLDEAAFLELVGEAGGG